jgi:hypothetical protein
MGSEPHSASVLPLPLFCVRACEVQVRSYVDGASLEARCSCSLSLRVRRRRRDRSGHRAGHRVGATPPAAARATTTTRQPTVFLVLRAHLGRFTVRLGRAGGRARAPSRSSTRCSWAPGTGWQADWDVSEQPFREALGCTGCTLAFEAFAQAFYVWGLPCVLRNDAAAAIASFRKGSTQSPPMQCCALQPDRAAAVVEVDCLPFHVQGLNLVA